MAQWAKVLSLESVVADYFHNPGAGDGEMGGVAARDCWLASLTKRGKLLAQ